MIDFLMKKRSLKFHFWATIFSGGIWLFIYLSTLLYAKNTYSQGNIHQLCAQKSLSNAKTLKTDLVEFSYHCACCSECAKYRGRVFSISGKDKRFPKLPEYILKTGSIHEGCRCSFYPFIYGISEPSYNKAKDIIQFSNRPFIDDRTKEEIINYEKFK